MADRMKRITVDLDEGLWKRLRLAVIEREMTSSEIIRGLLERDLYRVQWPPIDMYRPSTSSREEPAK
jgi:metal-responsive CopG/Arc/MetJ family transcriptional regulator